MPYITQHEETLFYTDQGHPSRPVLILVHGAGGSHLDWPADIRRLPNARVITVDLPGHGRSKGAIRTTINQYAEDIGLLISELELMNVIVAGYSMGGAIALQIGLNNLPTIVGLVLIATGARLRVANQIFDLINNDFLEAVNFINSTGWSSNTPQEVIARGFDQLSQTNPSVLYNDFVACDSFDIMSQLPSIQVPALVINGTIDNRTPPKYGRYLADHLAMAEYFEIEGAGHMVAIEQSRLVAEAISRFIERLS